MEGTNRIRLMLIGNYAASFAGTEAFESVMPEA